MKEESKLENLSLSDAETLLNQEMDELIGGDNYYCTCEYGAQSVKSA